MRKIILGILFLTGFMILISCKKETGSITSSTPPQPAKVNKPPLANAGPDIFITQQACGFMSWTELDGSGSFDPDSTTISFHWRQISGPACTVSNNGSKKAIALNLRRGLYRFELMVKNARGLSSRDTVVVDATQWMIPEFDLDITIIGTYSFVDNYKDCFEGTCEYADLTSIEGVGNFSPFGDFKLNIYEWADTASSSNDHSTGFNFRSLYNSANQVNLTGNCSVFFKKLIQNGGGVINGTIKTTDGSVSKCDTSLLNKIPPLTISGNIDTTTHTVNLRIRGKVFF